MPWSGFTVQIRRAALSQSSAALDRGVAPAGGTATVTTRLRVAMAPCGSRAWTVAR